MDIFKVFAEQTPVVDIFSLIASTILSVLSIAITVVETRRTQKDRKRKIKQNQQADMCRVNIANMVAVLDDFDGIQECIENRNKQFVKCEEAILNLTSFYEKPLGNKMDEQKVIKSFQDEFNGVLEREKLLLQEYEKKKELFKPNIEVILNNSDILNALQTNLFLKLIDDYQSSATFLIELGSYINKNVHIGDSIHAKKAMILVSDIADKQLVLRGKFDFLKQSAYLFKESLITDKSKTVLLCEDKENLNK